MTIHQHGWINIEGGIRHWDEARSTIVILTRRQDDILLINYLSHTPSHSFLLELLGDEWT